MAQAEPSRAAADGPLARGLSALTRAVSAAGSLMIVMLMAAINLDVGGRYLFNHPIPGTAEVISASIVSIIFLQLPDCIRSGRMIRSDILIERVVKARPKLGQVFELCFSILGFCMLAVVVRYIAPAVHKAWVSHHMLGVPGIFTAPIWPFYLLVLVGAVLATLEYLRLTIVNVAALRRPGA